MSDKCAKAVPRVVVGRWTNTYLALAGHPSPDDLRRQLDQCLASHLSDVCGASLRSVLDPEDPAVWRIRDLSLDFAVNLSLHSELAVARRWGENLAAQVGVIFHGSEQGDSILRFETRAAYLARFLLDLACGHAWGKWYYEEFDSLRSLSSSQAIATALEAEPEQAAPVILSLAKTQQLGQLLGALTDGDAAKIYQACFNKASPDSSADEALWTGRILKLWAEGPLCAASERPSRFRETLLLLTRVVARFPGCERSSSVKNALDGLFELRGVLRTIRSPAALTSVISALARQDLQSAISHALRAGASEPRAGLEFLARTMGGDVVWAMQAAGVVLSDHVQNASAAAKTVYDDETILSSFGGIFLLGPSFVDLDVCGIIDAATSQVPVPERLAALFRKIIAVKCIGRKRALAAASDAALRFFSGSNAANFSEALQELSVTRWNLDQARLTFVRSLAAQHRCEGRYLLAQKVSDSSDANEALLITDVAQNQWLYLTEMPSDETLCQDRLKQGLTLVSKATGNRLECLFLGPGLDGFAKSAVFRWHAERITTIHALEPSSWPLAATELGVREEQFAQAAKPAASDLSYFSLAGPWPNVPLDAEADLALSLIARAVLRNFAGKLMGFEHSSPEHLYQNFLAGVSAIRASRDRISVRLPECPLSVLLRISGVWHQTYSLHWLRGIEVCLQPPP